MSVPLKVTGLKVRSLDLDFQEISWKVGDSHEDPLDYTFQVLRSESPSGPFDALGAPFSDRYYMRDNTVQVAHRWRQYFYVIRVTRKRDGASEDFGPVALEPEPDLTALELRRHIHLLMHEFVGRKCWVLPKRTFGQRCSCFDTRLGKKTIANCRLCFDTGFVRGFLSPIEIWIQFDPSPKTEQNAELGGMHQSNTTARLGYFPPLKPNDIIIEPENRRWRVVQVNQTEHSRAAVHQEVSLHEIPRTDVEFAIPLKLEEALSEATFTPPRNFSNPHNLENFEDEVIPNIFALYTTVPEKP